jgi:hypothetical protein
VPGDFFVKMVLGGLIIGVLVAYALAATYAAGRKSERGGSKTTGVPGSVVCILIALGVAFSLGQAFPYVELFNWFHSLMALRQPCC